MYIRYIAVLLLLVSAQLSAASSNYYTIGKENAQKLVSSSWEAFGKNCSNYERFEQIIKDNQLGETEQHYTGKSLQDFRRGYKAGISESMKNIFSNCNSTTSSKEEISTYYSMGKQGAENQVNAAFSDLGCVSFDKFRNIIDKQVNFTITQMQTKYKGTAAKEFGKGYIDGLKTSIEYLQESCSSWSTEEIDKTIEKYTFSIKKRKQIPTDN